MFSQQKYLLLLFFVLRYPIDKDSQEFNKLESYMVKDLEFCPECFQNQSDFCNRIPFDYEFNEGLTDNLNILFGVRHNRVLRSIKNHNHQIMAKYLARDFDFDFIDQEKNQKKLIEKLSKQFFNESRLEGMHVCPKSGVQRFVNVFQKKYSEISIWMHMNVDIQSILLPHLESIGFPVPKTYATCGFTIFQSVDGVPLANLFSSNLIVKLRIAKQLLEGVLKFTEGFDNFRIYITDLNMDNVVYDSMEDRLSFVDLDTVLIVDGRQNPGTVFKHEFIECNDCFAFSPTDICASDRSDINVFAACQILREDLKKDRSGGFLFPIPEEYSHLEVKLNECVYCMEDTCENRLKVAVELIDILEKMIVSLVK